MNILIINGSPKGERSNSLRLTQAFVKGLKEKYSEQGVEVKIEQLDICKMQIGSCKGCFVCWKTTPGQCCIKDDMPKVIEKEVWADLIIYSFPLYYFNVPGSLKNMIDRQLPMILPFMSEREDGVGSGSHDTRYDMSGKKYVLISTCGFYSAEGNYDSVRQMFNHICGKDNYETIFCGQGELFAVKELSARTDEYLKTVEQAGMEYTSGEVSYTINERLKELLFPKEIFEKMADASWGVSRETGKKEDESLIFTRQMAALYNKKSFDGTDRVLEICYTDLGKTYQILLGEKGSEVSTELQRKYTTRIETPWEVWQAVARNEIRGDVALAKQMYRVQGDFSLMINWDRFFGNGQDDVVVKPETTKQAENRKPPVMATMLIAWITFWTAISASEQMGALIVLAVGACLPILMIKYEFTLYDKLSIAFTSLLSIFVFMTNYGSMAVNIGYLLFGLMWLASCFTKEPLCACYVKYNYNGEDALKNPIFMKTNYILAAVWGILYVIIAAWTYLFAKTAWAELIIILNYIMPIIMGFFTVWFEKWYPAWIASGKR